MVRKSIFEELNSMYSPASVEGRGEDAWAAAVKFLTMLDEQIRDDDEKKKLMSAWMKSVKDNDFRKFKRALRRYNKKLEEDK